MKRDADAAFGSQAGPSSISLPSPPVDAESPASESPEYTSGDQSRKRSRSEVTPEERKEARAHRNRIAAQNSRDRRKAQFSYLEQRVADLEEENRKLRAGMSLTELSRSVEPSHEQREKELARERENAELKEKIKSLENGWEAVMKALAASGLPLSLPIPSTSAAPSSSTPASSSDSASQPPTTTFPVIIPPLPVFPLSPAPTASPALSSHIDFDESESTRHLARVATADAPRLSSAPLQRVDTDRLLFNSSSLLQLLMLPPTSISLRQRPQSMRWPWRTYSGKSSLRAPPSRRRLCLFFPPAKTSRHPKSRPPCPPRR